MPVHGSQSASMMMRCLIASDQERQVVRFARSQASRQLHNVLPHASRSRIRGKTKICKQLNFHAIKGLPLPISFIGRNGRPLAGIILMIAAAVTE